MKCKGYADTLLVLDEDVQICHKSGEYLPPRRKHDAWEKLFTLTMFYGGKLCKNCQGVGGNSLFSRPSEGVSTFALVL